MAMKMAYINSYQIISRYQPAKMTSTVTNGVSLFNINGVCKIGSGVAAA